MQPKLLAITSAGILLLQTGCATLPDNLNRTRSFAISNTRNTELANALQKDDRIAGGRSGFYALQNGRDGFAVRASLARMAGKSIDAQYYLLNDDQTGRLFLALLTEAADRGVRVRLLLDDIATEGIDRELLALDAHPMMQVSIFSPSSRQASRFSRSADYRMRNRSFTVDNQATILGGRNIGDQYFDEHTGVVPNDLEVLSVGPLASAVSESFDKFWNNVQTFRISAIDKNIPTQEEAIAARQALLQILNQNSTYAAEWHESEIVSDLRRGDLELLWGKATLFADHPDKWRKPGKQQEASLSETARAVLASAYREVTIFSPCFVPGKTGTDALCDLVTKGIKVRILTNSLKSDSHPAIHARYARYRKALLLGGVDLYETKATAEHGHTSQVPHTKTFVIDRESVFVGAPDFDARAFAENTDIGIQFVAEDLAGEMADWFDQSVEQVAYRLGLHTNAWGGRSIVWKTGNDEIRKEPQTNPWDRMKVRFYRLLPAA